MRPPKNFWLALNELAQALEAEGVSHERCMAHILDEWQEMRPVAREAILDDAKIMAMFLQELCSKARHRIGVASKNGRVQFLGKA